MDQLYIKGKLGVWLLLAILMLPIVVQDIHFYQEHTIAKCEHEEHNDAPEHDCHSCPICHYTLASFTLPERVVCSYTPPVYTVFIPVFTEDLSITPLYSRPGRGPPVC